MTTPKPDQTHLYTRLAWLWPLTSPVGDYEEEAGEFIDLLRTRSEKPVTTVLHLGCGGGHLDHWLKHVFQITGVDLSADMLAHARGLNPTASYHLGDMRTFRLDQTFDAVICADSIEYMLTETDLKATMETAYTHLAPGGIFCTYAEETLERFDQNKTNTTTHTQGSTSVTAVENFFDPDPEDTSYESTFIYIIRRDGKLSIEQDRHLCGLFSFNTWIALLEESGFTVEVVDYEEAGPMFIGRKQAV